MSDCTIAAQVLEKREEPAEYLVDRMIRICRDQLMLPIRQTMERIDCHEICFMESRYYTWKTISVFMMIMQFNDIHRAGISILTQHYTR